MLASRKQIGFIKGLAKKHSMEVSSEELKDLTYEEADRMIKSLSGVPAVTPEQKMKNKIISMARTIGWIIGEKADIQAINTWCVHKGMYGKRLDDHTAQELPHLVSQFQMGPFKHALQNRKKAHA